MARINHSANYLFSNDREERREWFILAMLSEWIQREGGGHLAKSDVEGLERIPAVDVYYEDGSYNVFLTGADEQRILAELRVGLEKIAFYNDRALAAITEKNNGFEFRIKTRGEFIDFYANKFALETVKKSDHMILRFKTIKQHDKVWVPLELLTRQAAIYLFDRIPELRQYDQK